MVDTAIADSGTELVLYGVEDGVCTITVNRPERNNAWSIEIEECYFERLDDASRDPQVRAIVLTATGRHVWSGPRRGAPRAEGPGRPAPVRTRPLTEPSRVDKPMIAAINGTIAGIGLVHARGSSSARRRQGERS